MSEAAEQNGLQVVTDEALAKRGSGRFDGEVDAQFQRLFRNEEGFDIFHVESYDREGFWESENIVQLKDDFYIWASCTCYWFREKYNRRTTCRHIYASVMKHRKRHQRRQAKAA